MALIPQWLDDNPSQFRPTEILVPVEYGIGPIWYPQDERGAWFARVNAVLPSGLNTDEHYPELLSCDHGGHATEDEAWECADGLARALVEGLVAR